MKRKFTKYPSSYVAATTEYPEVSATEFDQLVDSYKASDAGWSLIVAELKGTYGLDTAKEVADTVCYERRQSITSTSSCVEADVTASTDDTAAREAVKKYLTDANFLSMSSAEKKIVAKAQNSTNFQVYIVAAYEALDLAGVSTSAAFDEVYRIVIREWNFDAEETF